MKNEKIKLSEFIELLEESKAKRPMVPNYVKIVFMIEQLKLLLAHKGDVNISIKKFQNNLL